MNATPSNDLVEQVAERIRPYLLGVVENIILAGTELLNAKKELPHGSFGPLLARLGLSRQMANRFMRVASNTVLVNRSPVGGLPAAVSVLDVLTQLDDEQLVGALDAGAVTTATTREQALALVAEQRDGVTTEMKVHPVLALFPDFTGPSFDAFKEDIATNGLKVPGWRLSDGTVLDGRARARACQRIGVPMRWREYDGDDPAGLVISCNLLRTHATLSAGAR